MIIVPGWQSHSKKEHLLIRRIYEDEMIRRFSKWPGAIHASPGF
jgi:hypothetical protein